MIINWYGEGCFKIQSGGLSVVIDPLDNRLKADILLKTKTVLPLPQQNPAIVGSGEYEIKGVRVKGFAAGQNPKSLETVYRVEIENFILIFFGNPVKLPEITILEKLGGADIVFAPPGSAKLIKQLKPKIIIPAFFKNSKEVAKNFEEKIEEQEKLTIKKKDLPTSVKVIFLKS